MTSASRLIESLHSETHCPHRGNAWHSPGFSSSPRRSGASQTFIAYLPQAALDPFPLTWAWEKRRTRVFSLPISQPSRVLQTPAGYLMLYAGIWVDFTTHS